MEINTKDELMAVIKQQSADILSLTETVASLSVPPKEDTPPKEGEETPPKEGEEAPPKEEEVDEIHQLLSGD